MDEGSYSASAYRAHCLGGTKFDTVCQEDELGIHACWHYNVFLVALSKAKV